MLVEIIIIIIIIINTIIIIIIIIIVIIIIVCFILYQLATMSRSIFLINRTFIIR